MNRSLVTYALGFVWGWFFYSNLPMLLVGIILIAVIMVVLDLD